ncbi:hypothetical protein M569_02387 [Genlisea aurea]|uniref:peroxidase n=1 Tax=Genlisea aurea TaxID=192259 RepID=S8EIL3_9LAMI|nr:hypothetical protein M569_02387 [Genlisea aurea]
MISLASQVSVNLPHTSDTVSQLAANFASKGLSKTDLAVLSGGHTFGISHCSTIRSRLYNSTGGISIDPTLNSTYAPILISLCPFNSTTANVSLDRITPNVFDFNYYVDIVQNAALFHSDGALLNDSTTSAYVLGHLLPGSTAVRFLVDFANSMLKMSNILNPATGQVRKNCAVLNS